MRKWPEQYNSQLSSSFCHLQQMFKGTGVVMRIWLDRDGGGGQDVKRKWVYKEEESSRKGDRSTILRKIRVRMRTLREKREQCFILSIICLIGQVCNKPISYINSWPLAFLPCFCPWAEPSYFVWPTLSGLVELCKSHCSKWTWVVEFLSPYRGN